MTVRYRADYEGTGRLMRSEQMLAVVTEAGWKALDRAREISPVRTGEYAAGWHMEVSERGGPNADRAEAQIVNDAGDRVLADVVDGHDVPAKVLAFLEEQGAL